MDGFLTDWGRGPILVRVAVVFNPTKVGIDDIRRRTADRASRHGWTDPLF